jgi:acetyltransferase
MVEQTPYPAELSQTLAWNGQTIELRPIRAEDEAAHRAFIEQLDPQDLWLRFFNVRREPTQRELDRLVHIDRAREMAFIATTHLPDGRHETLGVVRAVVDLDNIEAEFGIIVRSDLKAHGLGYALLTKMIAFLRERGTQRLVADVLRENHSMCEMVHTLGFELDKHTGVSDPLRFVLDLQARVTPAVAMSNRDDRTTSIQDTKR